MRPLRSITSSIGCCIHRRVGPCQPELALPTPGHRVRPPRRRCRCYAPGQPWPSDGTCGRSQVPRLVRQPSGGPLPMIPADADAAWAVEAAMASSRRLSEPAEFNGRRQQAPPIASTNPNCWKLSNTRWWVWREAAPLIRHLRLRLGTDRLPGRGGYRHALTRCGDGSKPAPARI